ncbi:MAG: amidohydrolase family protein [Lachnospiraceae bacterium]|nr:amidohydrolase family protein [Lachnospiraceae bacterium]
MKTLIKNARIVTSKEVLNGCICCFTDGVIDYIGKEDDKVVAPDVVIDAQQKYLVPGFVDIHCHGALGLSFMGANEAEFGRMADYHLSHGTTTLFVTTSTASMEMTEKTLDTFSSYKEKHPKSNLEAVHMEGPWLSPLQCGAQARTLMHTPDVEELRALKGKYPFLVRVDAAPELPQGMEFGRVGTKLGLKVGVAHSDAVFTEIEEAIGNGYTIMTHLYSGMKGVERVNAYRIAGAVEAGLYFDNLYAEIIADGKHLPLELLRFIYKCKGADKICMVTDATRGCGLPEGTITTTVSGTDGSSVIIEDGVAKLMNRQAFAGSVATTDRLYRTMAQAIGMDMVALSKMSSLTPARAMGLEDRGEIAVGKRADLLLLNEQLEIEQVITDRQV